MRRTIIAVIMFVPLAACGGAQWDPPPAGAEVLAVVGTPARYYTIEKRRNPGNVVQAITLTQFPPPANNAQGYTGWEVQCDLPDRPRLRYTGRGTLEEVRAGREATAAYQLPEAEALDHKIAVRLCQ